MPHPAERSSVREEEHQKTLRKELSKGCLQGRRQACRGLPSGFRTRFKDPEMKIKGYRLQMIWIRSPSRWANIWIVFPRCRWPGLKSYRASPEAGGGGGGGAGGGWNRAGRQTQRAPKETAVSSSAHCGDCSVQRCGGSDQSGFRHEMQTFISPGSHHRLPPTLTKPRCLEKKFAWY